MDKIAIVGAGSVGSSLGARLAERGFSVRYGVKASADLKDLQSKVPGAATSGVAEAVGWADVVFLAVPAAAAVEALRPAGDLSGKVVCDCTNPVGWGDEGPELEAPPEGSVAEALSKAFPKAEVVKGFNTFGAEFHRNPELGGGQAADVYLAGSELAKKRVGVIASQAGFTPVDCGSLARAGLLENLAVLWIYLATKGGQGRDVAFKLLKRG